jgi:hypothetical protein
MVELALLTQKLWRTLHTNLYSEIPEPSFNLSKLFLNGVWQESKGRCLSRV